MTPTSPTTPAPPAIPPADREVVLALSEEQRRMIAAELALAEEAQRVAERNIRKLLCFLLPEWGAPGSKLLFDATRGQVYRPVAAPPAASPAAE